MRVKEMCTKFLRKGVVRWCIPLFALYALVACASAQVANHPTVIYKRFGGKDLPTYEVRVSPDGLLEYKGIGNVRLQGLHRRQISNDQYKSLLRVFDDSQFMKMDAQYGSSLISPTAVSITFVTASGSERTVNASSFPVGWPRNLIALIWGIEDTLALNELACPMNLRTENGRVLELCAVVRAAQKKAFGEAK